MSTPELKKYNETLDQITNSAFVGHAIALGSKLGLFKLINEFCSQAEPKSSTEIADKANMKERYVREWLNCMVAAKLVECDADVKHYWMIPGAYESLTGGGSLIAFVPHFLDDLTQVSPRIAACFAKNGPRGTEYSQYPNFHRAMDDFSRPMFENELTQKILPDLLGEYKIPDLLCHKENVHILDIGCSVGSAVRAMAKAYPKTKVFGIDYNSKAIESAQSNNRDLSNVHFAFGDACKMLDDHPDWASKFDLITNFEAVHDLSRPDLLLKSIPSLLKPGGVFLCADDYCTSNAARDRDTILTAAAIYTVSLFHCMPVSLNYEDGLGYGAAWGIKTATELMERCGLNGVQLKLVPGDYNAYYIWHKPIN